MNWYKIAQKQRGRYRGQQAGDEHNQFSTNERYQDNELVEGEDGAELRKCFLEGLKGNWTPLKICVQELLQKGYSQSRIDAMIGSYTRMKVY